MLALNGESMLDMAGLGGSLRLGNDAALVGGADMGAEVGKGLGGTAGAVKGGGVDLLLAVEVGDGASLLGKRPARSVPGTLSGTLSGTLLAGSGLESPDGRDGESNAMAFDRKSV